MTLRERAGWGQAEARRALAVPMHPYADLKTVIISVLRAHNKFAGVTRWLAEQMTGTGRPSETCSMLAML